MAEQKKVLQKAMKSGLITLETLVDLKELELFSKLSSVYGIFPLSEIKNKIENLKKAYLIQEISMILSI